MHRGLDGRHSLHCFAVYFFSEPPSRDRWSDRLGTVAELRGSVPELAEFRYVDLGYLRPLVYLRREEKTVSYEAVFF